MQILFRNRNAEKGSGATLFIEEPILKDKKNKLKNEEDYSFNYR